MEKYLRQYIPSLTYNPNINGWSALVHVQLDISPEWDWKKPKESHEKNKNYIITQITKIRNGMNSDFDELVARIEREHKFYFLPTKEREIEPFTSIGEEHKFI